MCRFTNVRMCKYANVQMGAQRMGANSPDFALYTELRKCANKLRCSCALYGGDV